MRKEENSGINKRLYKTVLLFIKVIPMLLAITEALNTTLDLLWINTSILSYFGGVSFLTLAFLYLISYVFRFCRYHRMFLHYVLVNNTLCIIEYTVGIPVSYAGLIAIFIVTFCVFLFLILYFYRKERCCRQLKNCF